MYTNDSKTQRYRKMYNLKDMGLIPIFLSSETSILMHRLDSNHSPFIYEDNIACACVNICVTVTSLWLA